MLLIRQSGSSYSEFLLGLLILPKSLSNRIVDQTMTGISGFVNLRKFAIIRKI